MRERRKIGMTPNAAAVPDGWQVVRLGDVAEVAFSSVDKKTIDGEMPVELCNYTDVFYNRRILPDMPFMAATASPVECDRWSLRQGDVLFTKDSETPDEIGIPSYVVEDMPDVLCGYHLALARPAPRAASGSFLARALGSHAAAREFARIANGVTRFGLTLGATRSLPLLLPPLAEQRAIAAVLDAIDEAIERTEEVIVATERLRDALLHELLTRGLPGRHSEWTDVPGLGTVPASWDVVRLGDVAHVVMGQSPPGSRCNRSGEGTPLLNGPTEFGSVHPVPAQWTTAPAKTAVVGDLLFCVRGATVGRTNWADTGYAIGRGIAAIRHRGGVEFQAFVGALVEFRLPRLLSAVAGSTFPNLSSSEILDLPIGSPPPEEQRAIASALDGVDGTIERAREERARLHSLQASAADALLAGRVRVASA